MSIEKSIKSYAKKIGMDLCGIAPVSRFEGAPQGTHPCDLLPGCKSVIVVGLRLVDGVIQTIMRNFEDGNKMAQGIYGTYGYSMAPNYHLFYCVYAIAQYVERNTGFATTPTQQGPGILTSHRHAAVAAGLGEFGWLSMVLTPQFGPRNRFATVLTTAEFKPDPMYSGPQLCNPNNCDICTKVCPTGALSKFGEKEARRVTYKDGEVKKTYDYCHVDQTRCLIASYALMKKTGGTQDLVTALDVSAQELAEAIKKKPVGGGIQALPSSNCGKCLAYCPVGNWKEKFKDTDFSSRLPITEW